MVKVVKWRCVIMPKLGLSNWIIKCLSKNLKKFLEWKLKLWLWSITLVSDKILGHLTWFWVIHWFYYAKIVKFHNGKKWENANLLALKKWVKHRIGFSPMMEVIVYVIGFNFTIESITKFLVGSLIMTLEHGEISMLNYAKKLA